MEDFNLPKQVRFTIYVVTSLSSILIAYLSATNQLTTEAVTALAAVNVFVTGLAGYNTQK